MLITLSNNIRGVIPENQLRFPLGKVQHHFCEVRVSPGEPGTSVIGVAVNGLRFMDQPQAGSILQQIMRSYRLSQC